MLTLEQVRARVAEIRRLVEVEHDPEAAHAAEDDLYGDVLRAIFECGPDVQAMAEEALKTKGIDFGRWCG